MIASFIISAGLTLILTTLYFCIQSPVEIGIINALDIWTRKRLSSFVGRYLRADRAALFAAVLQDVVLTLSDQQLVTGIAILTAGFVLLSNGSISVYHFSIVQDLAWLASNTHLLSILVIRDRLLSNSDLRSDDKLPTGLSLFTFRKGFKGDVPFVRGWRAFLMIAHGALLLASTIVTGFVNWGDDDVFICPAQCTLPYEKGGVPGQWMAANIALIAISYPTTMFSIFESLTRMWIRLREKGQAWLDDTLHHDRLKRVLRAVLPWCMPLWHFLFSDTADILTQSIWFALGIYYLLADLYHGRGLMSGEELVAERRLGFGQLVPLLLLMLPLMVALESYKG